MATLKTNKAICPGGTLNNIHPKFLTHPVQATGSVSYLSKIAEIFEDTHSGTFSEYELESSPTSYFGTIWATTTGESNS
jgi:hypothetical protein